MHQDTTGLREPILTGSTAKPKRIARKDEDIVIEGLSTSETGIVDPALKSPYFDKAALIQQRLDRRQSITAPTHRVRHRFEDEQYCASGQPCC